MAKPKSQSQNRAVPLLLFCGLAGAGVIGLLQQTANAVEDLPTTEAIAKLCNYPIPATDPLDLTPLNPKRGAPVGVITSHTISQYGLSNPSLWWAAEQFGGKLLDNWLAYPGTAVAPGRVDLVVNRQLWSLLNYLERYQFVSQFGKVAQEQTSPYNVRIFNRQGAFLAAYTCAGSSDSAVCSVCLESSGKAGNLGGN